MSIRDIHRDDDDWQGAVDTDGMPARWHNVYYCRRCAEAWHDTWSCMCNDRCPVCDRETEPESSYWLDLEGHVDTTVVIED
jgi:hypothetical protein